MSALLLPPNLGIKNVVPKKEFCTCPRHRGSWIHQIDADLPNGVHFRIMKDRFGHYFAIGDWDEDTPPPQVEPEEIEYMLLEALGG